MKRRFLQSLSVLFGLAAAAGAQTGALLHNTLTNHDLVVLAQAGFNENFIIDLIGMSRTRFDTSVTGLAEMAKEGLTERLIRATLSAEATPQAAAAAAPVTATRAIEPAALLAAPIEVSNRRKEPKPTEGVLAIGSQAPYLRTSSFFWGFWKKKTAVGAGLRADQPIGVQLGTAYGQMPWISPAGARYVVLP